MRVITGTARGRRLKTLEGNDVRPTTDKVKEAIFSSIQFDIEGRTVLDLFAGSGQMGIEALSRGAKKAVFTDANADAVSVINENLQCTGLKGSASVFKADAFTFLATCGEKFDVAFLDPPYHKGLLEKALRKTADVMGDYGIIICEHPIELSLPENVGSFICKKQAKYGKIMVSFYRRTGIEL